MFKTSLCLRQTNADLIDTHRLSLELMLRSDSVESEDGMVFAICRFGFLNLINFFVVKIMVLIVFVFL
jgi:hypothetical protein